MSSVNSPYYSIKFALMQELLLFGKNREFKHCTYRIVSSLSSRILKGIAAIHIALWQKPFSLTSPFLARTLIIEHGATGPSGNLPESFGKETHFSADINRNSKFLHKRLLFLVCTATWRLRRRPITLRIGWAFKGYLSRKVVCLGVWCLLRQACLTSWRLTESLTSALCCWFQSRAHRYLVQCLQPFQLAEILEEIPQVVWCFKILQL